MDYNCENKVDDITCIFDTMNYGPALDSEEPAKDWLSNHDNKLGFFIDGKWQFPSHHETVNVPQLSNEVPVDVIVSETQDIENAINSASKAFSEWSKTPGHVRAHYMHSIVKNIQKNQHLITILETVQSEKPLYQVKEFGLPSLIRSFKYFANCANLLKITERKPIGVVSIMINKCINPLMACWGIAPALAMGNTIFLIPHRMCCVVALLFAEICTFSGIPPGVVNVVPGNWDICCLAAKNPKINKILYHGLPSEVKDLQQKVAGLSKHLTVDVEGRPIVIILDTADIDSAVEGVIETLLYNDRRNYCGGVQVLVQESVQTSVIDKIENRASKIRLGNCLDKTIDMCDILDESMNSSITEYLENAKKFGARIFQGLPSINRSKTIPVTVISNIQTSVKIVSEAISGPFILILPFRTTVEAINLANNCKFASVVSLWSEKYNVIFETAKQLTSSIVWINGQNLMDPAVSYGSLVHSRSTRGGSKQAILDFTLPAWQSLWPTELSLERIDFKDFGQKSKIKSEINIKNQIQFKIENDKMKNDDCKNDNEEKAGSKPKPGCKNFYQLYYGGSQKKPDKEKYYAILNKEKNVLGYVAEANAKDIFNAVQSANAALLGWKNKNAQNRADILYSIAENLKLKINQFSKCLSELNEDSYEKNEKEIQIAIQRILYAAAQADKHKGTIIETFFKGTVLQITEPLGIIVIICPNSDQYSFLSFISLIAPAIAMGNTVIVIPGQYNSISALSMHEIFNISKLPNGVINILTGDEDYLLRCISEYRCIQAIWYHSNLTTGAAFVEYISAENFEHVWIGYNIERDWLNDEHGQGTEFLNNSIKYKHVWLPTGSAFQ